MVKGAEHNIRIGLKKARRIAQRTFKLFQPCGTAAEAANLKRRLHVWRVSRDVKVGDKARPKRPCTRDLIGEVALLRKREKAEQGGREHVAGARIQQAGSHR